MIFKVPRFEIDLLFNKYYYLYVSYRGKMGEKHKIGKKTKILEGETQTREIQAHEVFPETCVIQAQMQRVTRNYCD